jgi:ribosomal protein S18 acetylase RimI-like enzyme
MRRGSLKIRSATNKDRDGIWRIFHQVVATGDTYAFDPAISRREALAYWFAPGTHAYVAERQSAGDGVTVAGEPAAFSMATPVEDLQIVGTYILRPNQSGGGSHVANAAFMVAPETRGQGIGRAMGEHCLSEARRFGFRAMQFNFVVSTNQSAVRLWQQLGFEIVGTLPGAFCHPQKGYVDVYVMYRSLLAANCANKRE